MKPLYATTKARVYGTPNAWRFADQARDGELFQDCKVRLEIQGDDEGHCFFLIVSPEGFFTSDRWHETLQAAQERARMLLGVTRADWSE
ncbi:hypothetical protein Pan153_11930 [Gimesia panareensis]|uniref:Uncharacterized protein n=1 Tax=Gimesia panareensis TaxID=2527978 RepID=A0A518FJN3_9PLAN|nr:hypothetical protein [Gimesia panareensis]QDT27003.1 hypothetical protein Enr10x_23170 [Gimesia panareensis]QDV16562.1 hypothetical protein Pan153_11930 [Gimesia panareensis]